MMRSRDQRTDEKPRCWNCGRTLAKHVTRPWAIKCHRCETQNHRAPDPVKPSALDKTSVK